MNPGPAQALRLPAPAKLNLFLHITGRRPDGYHELETLFLFLDHGDELTLRRRDDGLINRVHGPSAVAPQSDLCLRAARALQHRCGVAAGADIGLHKRLPMGGGVGGGSSDAASVLMGLNRLWDCALDELAMAELALELGADVPVFVRGHAAFAAGVGERLNPVCLPPRWFLVLCPPVQVSTGGVFGDPSLTRNTKPLKIGGFPWKTDPDLALEALWRQTRNDCEPVVCAREPQVARARDWLQRRAPARMTGSGACVFAMLASERQARELGRSAQRELGAAVGGDSDPDSAGARTQLTSFVAAGLNRSPLHQVMARDGGAGG